MLCEGNTYGFVLFLMGMGCSWVNSDNFMFRRNKSSSNIEGVQRNLFKEGKKNILDHFEQRTNNRGQNSAILVI